jgi:hypothetical protein
MKNNLIGKSIQDEQELLHAVVEILNAIPITEWRDVFLMPPAIRNAESCPITTFM